VALTSVRAARAEGIKVGLMRPITLAPYPRQALAELAERVKGILVVEMNSGQMLDDVLLAVGEKTPVEFYGRLGGVMPLPDEVLAEVRRMAGGAISTQGHPRERWLKRMAAMN
jgi:2-oxoglutarate ferredoxin oxidoreductase subunit alpha